VSNKYTVPITEEITYLYEVEAKNGYEAAAIAGVLHASPERKPTHQLPTRQSLGKILPTAEGAKLGRIAGADEHEVKGTSRT